MTQHSHHVATWSRVDDYILTGECECGQVLFDLSKDFDGGGLSIKSRNQILAKVERLYKEANHITR
jgi:hypothetical protein